MANVALSGAVIASDETGSDGGDVCFCDLYPEGCPMECETIQLVDFEKIVGNAYRLPPGGQALMSLDKRYGWSPERTSMACRWRSKGVFCDAIVGILTT